MIEDTRRDYIRCVKRLAAVIGRSSDTATAEDLRRFQVHQTQADMQPPGITSAVSAQGFFCMVLRPANECKRGCFDATFLMFLHSDWSGHQGPSVRKSAFGSSSTIT